MFCVIEDVLPSFRRKRESTLLLPRRVKAQWMTSFAVLKRLPLAPE
jgi:hypothetical protein